MNAAVLAECQQGLPGWRGLSPHDFDFAPPKGFSTFTMAVRARGPASPPAVLYRRLAGKENAILDPAAERAVYLALSDAGVAARCHHYAEGFRLEGFYTGGTLAADDVLDPSVLRAIGIQLSRLHRLRPPRLSARPFFELLHRKWGPMARRVLVEGRAGFPEPEQALCDPLTEIYSEATLRRVARCVPDGPLTFCHNDTYHGNIMRLEDGRIRLLDFEFSCLNHPAFDFANLFAETVMEHGLADPPHFRIGSPRYGDAEIATLVDAYLETSDLDPTARAAEQRALIAATRAMIPLSDYMYAMAALPLALAPLQKIRFLPYASQRFARFRAACAGD